MLGFRAYSYCAAAYSKKEEQDESRQEEKKKREQKVYTSKWIRGALQQRGAHIERPT